MAPDARPDPLLDELRAIRASLWEEAGHDLERVAEEHRRIAEQLQDRIVRKPGDDPQKPNA